jgi:DNA-binding CsgD family transcriptional regulator
MATTVTEAAEELAARNQAIATIRGASAHARGLLTGNVEQLDDAVTLLVRGERPLATAAAREDLGSAFADRDASTAAVPPLEAAYDAYEAAGSVRDAARARAKLRRLGVVKRHPAVARPMRGWESLTPAELSVCYAVADGLTSNDVAVRLYLSPNTVNTHLRHAFSKLGIRSRVELTRIVLLRDHHSR